MNILTTLGETKKDESATVYNIVYIGGVRVRLNTGVAVLVSDWDPKKSKVKGTGKESKDKNRIIQQRRSLINDIDIKFRLQNRTLTVNQLKQEYKNPTLSIDFLAFARAEIKEREKTNDIAHGTAKQHKASINKLEQFRNNITFSEITPDFIENYRRWLKRKKQKINTINQALKTFKAYVSIAVRKEIITHNPFTVISIKQERTARVYLTHAEFKKLLGIYTKNQLKPHLQSVLRHYLFMCVTGMRYSDVAYCATFDNIIANTMVYVPYKTRKQKSEPVKLPLISLAKQLIKDEGRKTGGCFNVIQEQPMNRFLKTIANEAEINKNLTTHTGRHTFATLFILNTKNVAVLQKLLGHSQIAQTMVYVHITEQQTTAEMLSFEQLL